MKTKTSIVAENVRLQQWAELIRESQNRPSDMKLDVWCEERGITKANYYYRLRRVREACLLACETQGTFVELPVPQRVVSSNADMPATANSPVARLSLSNGISIELQNHASSDFMKNLLGALGYVE